MGRMCKKCGREVPEDGYDPCIVSLIAEFNKIEGVETYESCCGHGTHPTWIFMFCEDFPAIVRLREYISSHEIDGHQQRLFVESNSGSCKIIFCYECISNEDYRKVINHERR